MTARTHATPADAVTDLILERVFVDDYSFELERPSGIDKLWDHPAVRAAYAADEYIPYWSELWPAGRMLAKAIVREDWTGMEAKFGRPLEVLEVGCGLGLAGIAALAKEMRVTFTDIDRTAAIPEVLRHDIPGLSPRAAHGHRAIRHTKGQDRARLTT